MGERGRLGKRVGEGLRGATHLRCSITTAFGYS